jgi:putative DNA primase/helicase
MDRLFRSRRWRPKWDKEHRKDGATYGKMTIERACQDCSEVYSPRQKKPSVPSTTGQPKAAPAGQKRAELVLDGDLEDKTRSVIKWLDKHNNPPSIFLRGREIVHVVKDRNRSVIQVLERGDLRAFLMERLTFKQMKTIHKGEEEKTFLATTDPPLNLCENILRRSGWPFPPLEEVIHLPSLDRRGQLITSNGYQAELEAWVDLEGLKVDAPLKPTYKQVLHARSYIFDELLVDFPLVGEASKANALALALLPFLRSFIAGKEGCTPPHLVTATTERTGKSLLVDVLSNVAIGSTPNQITEATNEDEWRKRITSTLQTSPTIVKIDNVNRKLNSSSLASVFTSLWWEDRELGRTRNVRYRNNAVWTITANNPQASSELVKRCVWIHLDPKMENPEERTGFKHHPILPWVKANRSKLARALLTIIQGWVNAGHPKANKTLGSFEIWAETVGGILEFAEVEGFLENRKELIERADLSREEWKDFLAVWWEEHKTTEVTPSQLRELATSKELLGASLGDKSERSQDTRMGRSLLPRHEGQVFEVAVEAEKTIILQIEKSTTGHARKKVWKLKQVQQEVLF